MNTQETTTETSNGTTAAVTLAELANRPAIKLSRKQHQAVGQYARAVEAVEELAAKRDYLINQAAKVELEMNEAEKTAKVIGDTIYEG